MSKLLRWADAVNKCMKKIKWASLSLTWTPLSVSMHHGHQFWTHPYLSLYLFPNWAFPALTLHKALLDFESLTWLCSLNQLPGWGVDPKIKCSSLTESTCTKRYTPIVLLSLYQSRYNPFFVFLVCIVQIQLALELNVPQ